MDTKTLCLGALTFGEASGYDLKKVMRECFGHFLEVSHAAIYPALADLHTQGLVDCREVRQESRPDKRVYRITPAGLSALREALARSPGRHRIRSEFLALMFFADQLPPAHLQHVMDTRLEEFEAYIARAEAMLDTSPPQSPGVRFAAGYAVAVCRAASDYIRSNRQLLDDPTAPAAAGKGR